MESVGAEQLSLADSKQTVTKATLRGRKRLITEEYYMNRDIQHANIRFAENSKK